MPNEGAEFESQPLMVEVYPGKGFAQWAESERPKRKGKGKEWRAESAPHGDQPKAAEGSGEGVAGLWDGPPFGSQMVNGDVPEAAFHAIAEPELSRKAPVDLHGIGQGGIETAPDAVGAAPNAQGDSSRIADSHGVTFADQSPQKVGVGIGHLDAVRLKGQHAEALSLIGHVGGQGHEGLFSEDGAVGFDFGDEAQTDHPVAGPGGVFRDPAGP